MNEKNAGLEIVPVREEKEFFCENVTVLTTDLSVPEVTGIARKAAARLNGYYRLMLAEAARYAERHLFPAASEAFRRALSEGRLMPPFTLKLRYTVTLAKPDGALSLYTDMTERAGKDTVVLRRADTFSLTDGCPIPPLERRSHGRAARRCARMAQEFGVSAEQVRRRFRASRCCLTPDGLLAFFAPGDIASPNAGVIEMTLPPESEPAGKKNRRFEVST